MTSCIRYLGRCASSSRAAARLGTVFFVLAAIGVAGALCGCGQDTGGRVAVSGDVTFRGTAVKTGTIEFVSKNGAIQSGAPITDGKYAIPAPKGLTPGEYIVRISAVAEQGPAPTGPPGPESMKPRVQELIPSQYNTDTKLTATVPEGGSSKLNFELK